jgi:hypothetical protein
LISIDAMLHSFAGDQIPVHRIDKKGKNAKQRVARPSRDGYLKNSLYALSNQGDANCDEAD